MKKLFPSLLIALLGMPVPTLEAVASDCASSYHIQVDKPYDADNAEKTRKARCQASGENSSCAGTYNFMWEKYESYTHQSTDFCDSIKLRKEGGESTGDRDFYVEAKELQGAAKDKLDGIRKAQMSDVDKLKEFRTKNHAAAEKAVESADPKSKETIKRWVKQLNEAPALDKKNREKFHGSIDKWTTYPAADAPAVKKAKDELHASVDALYFTSMLKTDAAGRTGAAENLNRNTETNRRNAEGTGSSFGLSDAIPLLTLGVAAAGVAAAMMGNKSSASSADSGLTGTNPTPAAAAGDTTPAATTLPSSDLGSSGNGGAGAPTTSNPTFTAGPSDGQSVATFDQGTPNATSVTPTASSTNPGSDALPNQFSGALGGSPFSGSATSAPGGAGASMGSSGDARTLASEGGSAGAASHAGSGDTPLPASSGSMPAFNGGSAFGSSGGAEASLKEMFKGGDPFAMPNLGANAAGTLPDLGLAGAATDSPEGFAALNAENASAEAIPGADDTRSLFTRVKDFHKRSIKRGLVTSEAGGKI